MNIQTRPINKYPKTETPAHKRQRAPFKATWSATMSLLQTELRMLKAVAAVLEVDVKERDISSVTGWPKQGRAPTTPRVVLNIEKPIPKSGDRTEWLQFATDYFDDFEDNIRAIALGLESLRRVERYHITSSGEQYAGWKALPASTDDGMTADQAAGILAKHSGHMPSEVLRVERDAKHSLKMARLATHPDRHGEQSTAAYQQVERARAVLNKYNGWTL